MSIRDELIEVGCRAACAQNNEDPDHIAKSHWVTLGRPPAPNWKYREYAVAPIIDAVISKLKQRAASKGLRPDEQRSPVIAGQRERQTR